MNLVDKAIGDMVAKNTSEVYDSMSKWGAPTFGVPKNNDAVRVVTSFRRSNEAIKSNPWPMSTIQNKLHQCRGMTYISELDMITPYYVMNMREYMKECLVIILPWENIFIRECP